MLVNLVPEFLAATRAPDPVNAYRQYLETHRPILSSYWHNYILDLDSPHVDEVVRRVVQADYRDLRDLMEREKIDGVTEDMMARCEDTYGIDWPYDVYLMVGVGGANAGELVVDGRGIAFICLEHFTGRPNHETLGLGLMPDQIGVWLAHEIAHLVRYTSPKSRAELATVVEDAGGSYDCWDAGSRVTLLELLVNEGLAVAGSRLLAPDFEPWEYLGYTRRQYQRLRQLEAFLFHELRSEFLARGLGYRLRYLTGGVPATQRIVAGKVVPERAGYYVGDRLAEGMVTELGIGPALRESAESVLPFGQQDTDIQSA